MKFLYLIILLLSTLFLSCSQTKQNDLRLNEIQVVGSHNSYKQAIEKPLMAMILAKDSNSIGLDYQHIPIQEQLNLGLRGLEIDVLHDPTGGRYKSPKALALLREQGVEPIQYDTVGELMQPGLKVIHVADIDFRSHCLTFINCLREVKQWSDANPTHVPIIITINPKDSGLDEPGYTKVLPFTAQVLDSLDGEIRAVFSADKLITPDDVRGQHSSLREAVTTVGWPSLDASKGKILFVLDAPAEITDMYVKNSLTGKPMFPNVDATNVNAGFFIMNDPKTQKEDIQRLVQEGFMVRTRADADTREARTNDYTRLESAIASGAQLISTDYYLSRLSPTGKFQVQLPNKKYQNCNPVLATGACTL